MDYKGLVERAHSDRLAASLFDYKKSVRRIAFNVAVAADDALADHAKRKESRT